MRKPRRRTKTPRYRTNQRYHVILGERRTTVSVDTNVSDYLALFLRQTPRTEAAHAVIRSWLQARVDASNDPGRARVSQWLLGEIVEALARPSVVEAHGQWLMDTLLSETKE